LEQYTKTLACRIPMTRGQFILELRTFLFARTDSSLSGAFENGRLKGAL